MDFIYSEFNVSTLFRSLYQTFQSRVKDGVTLYCEIPEQDCVIYSEKNRLTQVITNFLTNACKFTFQGLTAWDTRRGKMDYTLRKRYRKRY